MGTTGLELESLYDSIQSDFLSIQSNGSSRTSHTMLPKLKDIWKMIQSPEGFYGLSTGVWDFDIMTTGLHPGDLIIMAARPSMGKTSLVLSIILNIAIEQGLPVLFFSLEMPVEHVLLRMISIESGVPYTSIRQGNYGRREDMHRTLDMLGNMSVLIDDGKWGKVQKVIREARHVKSEHKGLALVVVDYLQLLDDESLGAKASKHERLGSVTEKLKSLAWELKCPIIACSQLNREVEKRT